MKKILILLLLVFVSSFGKNTDELLVASREGNLKVVKQMLESKADVNMEDDNGYTPLIYASMEGHGKVVKELLKRGADVNRETTNGLTALMLANLLGHEDIAKDLIKEGADPNKGQEIVTYCPQ